MKKPLLLNNKTLFALLVTLSCVMSSPALAKKSKAVEFNEVVINSPFKLTQEIIAADVLPSKGKELVTFSIDEQSNRWLIIYQLDHTANQYVVAEKIIVPKAFYRFDLSKQTDEKQQSIYFLSTDSLFQYQTNKFKRLAKIESLYIQEQADFISRGDFIQDLNNDAFDDVVIADFNKTHVFIGQGLNTFAKQTLPIMPSVRVLSAGASYTETKLYFSDVNFDDKTDILVVGDGEMLVYSQYGASYFTKEATSITINKAISGTEWWNKRDESGEQLDQSDLEYRKIEELRDVNADGMTDMVVRYTKTSGVLDRVNDYEIFLGNKNQGMLGYAQEADSVIHAEGTLTGLEFVDINNDDKLEVLLAGFDIGLSQIIGALVTGGIDQDVYVFKMNKEDKFPTRPAIKKGVELTFSLTSGQSGSAIVKLADLNGDGLKELVLSDDDDELKIYLGIKTNKKKKSFKKRSVSYDTQIPKDGNLVMVEDLNGDGKDDLLMKFSRLDGEDKAKQFKVLFSQ
ncbi:FG-GAP repeat domain-containing protein [Colwellia sp. Bg11-28]|uniref:FG-GAP repeat domain-containing protein n=1 Tax=Colwellia sp. Bg11-28 TaxID=2058305 RepID=UPI000C330757|nr:VCBS repeat-containing protein [Colwellia sp. Bg11-28]PKH88230.1 VCBS repeat-containing protein [Colwellia sp. Bg11-28]